MVDRLLERPAIKLVLIATTMAIMAPIFHPRPAFAQEADIPFEPDSPPMGLDVESLGDGSFSFKSTERGLVVRIEPHCNEDPQSFTINFMRRGLKMGQKANVGIAFDLTTDTGVTSRRMRILPIIGRDNDPTTPYITSTDVAPGEYGIYDDPESLNQGIAAVRGITLRCPEPVFPDDRENEDII